MAGIQTSKQDVRLQVLKTYYCEPEPTPKKDDLSDSSTAPEKEAPKPDGTA